MKTLYEILEVAEDATCEQVKGAFKRLAKAHHPDLHGGDKAKEAAFKQITGAYEVLSDAERRRVYDNDLQADRDAEQAAVRARAEKEAEEARARGSRIGVIAVGGVVGLVGAGILYAMYRAADGGGARDRGDDGVTWDPYAQRYPGSDGRFHPNL